MNERQEKANVCTRAEEALSHISVKANCNFLYASNKKKKRGVRGSGREKDSRGRGGRSRRGRKFLLAE